MNSQTSINAALRGKINTQPPVEKQSGRFLPSETPRSVALDKEGAPPNLASNVSFNPVATINSANSQRYVAPVRNTYNRPVSTSVLNKDGQVAIRGERVIELNNNLHEQIKAKVNRQTPYEKKTLIAPTMAPTPVQPRPTQPQSTVVKSTEAASHDKARADELKKQLSEINKVLFEQIRQKIASELARQQNQVQTQASSTPKQPAFKTPKPVSGVPVSNPNALNQKATSASQPVVNQQKPGSAVAKAVEAPTQPKSPTTTAAKERPVPTTATQAQAFPAAPEKKQNVSPNKDEVQSHITNIEREIEELTKEIHHIDQSIASLETEKNQQELTALEQKITYDEKMMQAVTDWKYTLTNLVNSHSVALKYLKQKTDWLTDKVENIEGHREKHEKMHRKPRPFEIKLEKLPVQKQEPMPPLPVALPKPTLTPEGSYTFPQPIEPKQTAAVRTIQTNVSQPTEVKYSFPKPSEPRETSAATTIQSSISQPPEIREVIKKEEAKPEQVKQAVQEAIEAKKEELAPKVVEKQTLDQKAVESKVEEIAKEVLDKQQEQIKTGVKPEIESIVAKVVGEKLAEMRKANPSVPEKPIALSNLQANPVAISQQAANQTKVEVPANVTIGQPKVLPGNPAAQINIQAIPVESSAKPKENLPTITTGANLSAQADIERQILEAAAREEAAKDAIIKAKEEQERKRKEEEEKSKAQEQQKIQAAAQANEEVSQESLKEGLTHLKSSLTTTDNKALESLSKQDRENMMHKLETLEHQSQVSKQLDEIKAATERRKVNSEIQAMLERLGEKPKPEAKVSPPKQVQAGVQSTVETLKTQEKKEKSPEEKARIIAEIKALEREREARKLEERSKPVVKAQPAYGKMLPNTPTIPNVINGIVKDNKGLLMDTVVIIVKDQAGDPVRAFKTNKIGQFAVSTPLPNGVYTLELEKEGYDFDIIEVDVNGGILPPIEIKAR